MTRREDDPHSGVLIEIAIPLESIDLGRKTEIGWLGNGVGKAYEGLKIRKLLM
jgi:hypothetical protein